MTLFQSIENLVKQNLSLRLLRSSNIGNLKIRHNTCLPEIIKNNLLTGVNSLIPRKNVSFNYIVLYKPCLVIQANYYFTIT
ncbi:hypothetical protein CFPU101_26900 [Chroococcus sp. FPU101]|nr:hypothetical protein CFPU101_26900 [Chroococcus sp. FPU101]